MLDKYLKNPDYNFEKVNRASLACGPLVKWAIAQVTWQLCYYFESWPLLACSFVITLFEPRGPVVWTPGSISDCSDNPQTIFATTLLVNPF